MLTVVTWIWGDKYSFEYAHRLHRGLRRNLRQDFDFEVLTPLPEDAELVGRGCFCRLRMFDPGWQEEMLIRDRLVCLDLDVVITGPLDELFDRPESLVILRGANAKNPNPFNCSALMLRAGAHPEIWRDFSLERAEKIPRHDWADDQGWLWHKVPDAAGWQCGAESGIYAFRKPGWPSDDRLPRDARIVAFPGARDPSQFEHLDWVREHWR